MIPYCALLQHRFRSGKSPASAPSRTRGRGPAPPAARAPALRIASSATLPGSAAMTISVADVHRIAHLARIEIDTAEAEDVRAKLDAIFGMLDRLDAVDTTGVVPMAHAQDVMLPLRADAVTEEDRHALYQGVAPAVEAGLYLVPKVIE